MIEINIKSSNIKTIFYDDTVNVLLVFFKSGALYTYEDVSMSEVNKIMVLGGKYFYDEIRDKKKYSKKY